MEPNVKSNSEVHVSTKQAPFQHGVCWLLGGLFPEAHGKASKLLLDKGMLDECLARAQAPHA